MIDGEQVRRERERQRMSEEQLAAIADLGLGRLKQIEAGIHPGDELDLAALAAALGVTRDDLCL